MPTRKSQRHPTSTLHVRTPNYSVITYVDDSCQTPTRSLISATTHESVGAVSYVLEVSLDPSTISELSFLHRSSLLSLMFGCGTQHLFPSVAG